MNKKLKDIIVIGGGGHAKIVISLLKKISKYNILGYADIQDHGQVLGVKYLGYDDDVLKYDTKPTLALGIGQIKNISFRKSIVDLFKKNGFEFETIISPDSIINEEVEIGEGTVIIDGAVINSGSNIGKYSIVNTKVSVDHDCIIRDFVHIAPGVTICGGVKVEKDSFVGTGTTILQYKHIGTNCIVGAGSVVTKDIPDNVIAYGNTCEIIRENK